MAAEQVWAPLNMMSYIKKGETCCKSSGKQKKFLESKVVFIIIIIIIIVIIIIITLCSVDFHITIPQLI